MTPVLVKFDDGLLAAIDAVRGEVPRVVWIRQACEKEAKWGDRVVTRAGKQVVVPYEPLRESKLPDSVQEGPTRPAPGSRLKKR